MFVLRFVIVLSVTALGLAAAPASAQFFMRSHDFTGTPVTGAEADLGLNLAEATTTEQRAALVWNMRAALNVAALQCQFEPTLLTVANYNAMLTDHKDELKTAFDTVSKYFARTNKTAKAGQTALDQFSTRIYSNYATVAAQYGFCQTASSIGRDAIFAQRGTFVDLALARTRELRNSLIPYGEQGLPRYIGRDYATYPMLDDKCWNKKGEWQDRKCGEMVWRRAATAFARS
ncbi:hypothetical protein [Sphingomonas oligophenolica]|uniref:Uncharacterized protein n=1 Tax=Sphingomonas oligophenolica TaxID=301154 RepID=A0A502CRP5_9SPHN|nr:hypothetical protein [Sphingomonas oligophenolica]TPG15402.1 hypothetical protein EAH84_00920 [Sphingomonas oligophenolica]